MRTETMRALLQRIGKDGTATVVLTQDADLIAKGEKPKTSQVFNGVPPEAGTKLEFRGSTKNSFTEASRAPDTSQGRVYLDNGMGIPRDHSFLLGQPQIGGAKTAPIPAAPEPVSG